MENKSNISLPEEIYDSIANETDKWTWATANTLARNDELRLFVGTSPQTYMGVFGPGRSCVDLPWKWRRKLGKLIKKIWGKRKKEWERLTIADFLER
jgi:hypothetical protein